MCPLVTRLPKPGSPLPGLVPALAEVQTVVGGGREAGPWPDRSYYSCRGGLGRHPWEAELSPDTNKARGVQGYSWVIEDRARLSQSPSPSQSEEHRSALSLYDNLSIAGRTESLQEVFDMETSFQEHLQEDMYQTLVPEQIQGLQGDAASQDQSHWSSCEMVLAKSCSSKQGQNQDKDKEQESNPELDSGSCGFVQRDLVKQPKFLMPLPQHLPPSPLQLCQTKSQVLLSPAETQHPKQPSGSPRVPPPVPLADPSASALRSLLTSLQQQIIRQREEYEARIISLEQRNEELQGEVVRLKTNLSQQRHWYQVVQAKIVESERARAAAELHNATLQKEMEQFFDTFGELNNEAKKTEYIVKSF